MFSLGRGSKMFEVGGSNLENLEGGSHQNSTRGLGPFLQNQKFFNLGVKIFSTRGFKSFELGGSNVKIKKWGRQCFERGSMRGGPNPEVHSNQQKISQKLSQEFSQCKSCDINERETMPKLLHKSHNIITCG